MRPLARWASVAACLASLAACKRAGAPAPAQSDAAPLPTSAAAKLDGRAIDHAAWLDDERVVAAAGKELFRIAVETGNSEHIGSLPSDVEQLRVAGGVDVLALTKDRHVHVLGRGPLPVDVVAFFQVSANGKVVFVTRADGRDNTLVFDLVAYAERATIRGVPYADFLGFEGRYAIAIGGVYDTQTGARLDGIEGGTTWASVGERAVFLNDEGLSVFDVKTAKSVHLRAPCPEREGYTVVEDAVDPATRRAVRWCHDRVTVVAIDTLARVDLRIPKAPPVYDRDKFPWFTLREIHFAPDGKSLALVGRGTEPRSFRGTLEGRPTVVEDQEAPQLPLPPPERSPKRREWLAVEKG